MRRQPPISTRTDTRFPYTTLCLSKGAGGTQDGGGVGPLGDLDDPSSLSRVGAEAGRSAAAPGRRQPVARNRNDGGANGRGTGAGADAADYAHALLGGRRRPRCSAERPRSEAKTSELQYLMRMTYADIGL